jgi:asparaginyl-tRNA synthetase
LTDFERFMPVADYHEVMAHGEVPNVAIRQLKEFLGQQVTVQGWLYNRRASKKIQFLEVRDGTATVPATVVAGECPDTVFELASHLTQESAVRIVGEVRQHPKRPDEVELAVRDLSATPTHGEFPISPKEHGVDFLMDNRHLWLRSKRQHAILRVRHTIINAIRDFFNSDGFTLVDAPIFTPNACEGTSTLFETDFHDEPAYLTQSGQLYMEAAAAAFGKVYCFGPTFRAEKSKTRRHLAEFWMVEPEVAFMDLAGDMDLAERFLCDVVAKVLRDCRPELEVLERPIAKLEAIKAPFPRLSYDEAVERLAALGQHVAPEDDFGAEHETVLSQQFDRPIIVHRYPTAVKAFYMKPDPANPKRALCMDVLAPEGYGEIIGGGQRQDDLAALEAGIDVHALPREAFEWYLDLRRYGSFPHAGFGLGVERTVAWLCGLPHVRETIPFPRMLNRLRP